MASQQTNFWILRDIKADPVEYNPEMKKDDIIVAIMPPKNQVGSVRIENINPKFSDFTSKMQQMLMSDSLLYLRDGKKPKDNEKALKKTQEIIAKNPKEKTIKITENEYAEIME